MANKNTLRLTFVDETDAEAKDKVSTYAKIDEAATEETLKKFGEIMSGLKPEMTLEEIALVTEQDVTAEFEQYVADKEAAEAKAASEAAASSAAASSAAASAATEALSQASSAAPAPDATTDGGTK